MEVPLRKVEGRATRSSVSSVVMLHGLVPFSARGGSNEGRAGKEGEESVMPLQVE